MRGKPFVIFGAGGQVGSRLSLEAAAQGFEVKAHTHGSTDITDAARVRDAVRDAGFVANCAAYTAVDRAESEREAAFAVNATAPGLIAQACARAGVPLLHISTDYVFDGTGARPWREDDPVGPASVYGQSKEAGERAVRDICANHLILRISWVYDSAGHNFVRTMLRLGAERDRLRVVGDQHGGPTSAQDTAQAIVTMAKTALQPDFDGWGTYHFSGAPATAWFDFAQAIFAGRLSPLVERITTAEYPTPAKRPANSVLNCGKIARVFGIEQPDWRVSLARVLTEIEAERPA
jgi:dTDP-4-dehydrorhamnose reductase